VGLRTCFSRSFFSCFSRFSCSFFAAFAFALDGFSLSW